MLITLTTVPPVRYKLTGGLSFGKNLLFIILCYLHYIPAYPSVYKRFDALADFLGCSKKALAIRMKQLGLLKKEYLDNPFDLVTVYPEVSEL